MNHTPLCLSFVIFVMLATGYAASADPAWQKVSGEFATFELPADMTRMGGSSVDSIGEGYVSPQIQFGFDSETTVLPARLSGELERAVAAFAKQRRSDWKMDLDVPEGGCIHFSDDKENLRWYGKRYYLYFGFAAGEANFSLHVYFRDPSCLDDVERILRSIKLKTL